MIYDVRAKKIAGMSINEILKLGKELYETATPYYFKESNLTSAQKEIIIENRIKEFLEKYKKYKAQINLHRGSDWAKNSYNISYEILMEDRFKVLDVERSISYGSSKEVVKYIISCINGNTNFSFVTSKDEALDLYIGTVINLKGNVDVKYGTLDSSRADNYSIRQQDEPVTRKPIEMRFSKV